MDNTATHNDATLALGNERIGKLLFKYSVPAIIASVATSVYNIVDSIFIGRGVGPMAISGLAVTFPLMNLVMAFCMLIAVGGATIVSIYLGQGNKARATDVVNNVALLCLFNAVVFGSATLVFLDPILLFFGATADTITYAREFMKVILYATPVSYVFLGLNFLLRATGYPTKAMVSALISVVVNIALAPVFIYTLGWGIKGAALATVMGQGVSLVWVLIHFLNKNSYIHLDWHNNWFDSSIAKKIYGIGLSPFLMNVCGCVVVIFINRALLDVGGSDGNLAVGAYGIINRCTMFFVMVVFGVTQGMQPILGYNYGAGNYARVKSTLMRGIWIGCAITVIGWAVTELFPVSMSRLFTTDSKLVELAARGCRIYFVCYPLVGCQIVIQNFFQSVGRPKVSIFLSLTRQLIFLVPLLLWLPRVMGIDGVWAGMAASDALSFFLAVVTALVLVRRMQREMSPQSLPRD